MNVSFYQMYCLNSGGLYLCIFLWNILISLFQDDFEEVPGLGTQSRGKDIENIIEAERDEANGVDNGNEVWFYFFIYFNNLYQMDKL